MTIHRRNGNAYCSVINTAVLIPQLRLRQAIIGMTCATILLAGAMMVQVHASTSTPSSPSFSISKPTKLLALNVGGSTVGTSMVSLQQLHQQPYPYKDEDFVIPTMKEQPRFIQSYMNPQAIQRTRSITSSSTNWIILALTAISFSKALYEKLTKSNMNANSLQPTTTIEDNSENKNEIDGIFEITSTEEDIDIMSPLTDRQPEIGRAHV